MYKQQYSLKEDGSAEFSGDPVRVKKNVSYATVSEQHRRTNFNSKSKSEMKTNGKCTCTVDSLIQNEATNFTEEDRAWLSELPQEQLNKLAPKDEKPAPAANKKAAEPAKEGESLVKKNDDGSISINGKTISDYIKEELGKEKDPNKFIDNVFPDGLKEQMKSGLAMYQNTRSKMIKEIAANSKFKEDQLKSWTDGDLKSLHETLVDNEEGGNYAPLAGGSLEEGEGEDDNDSAESISAMMSFSPPKKEESKKK
jgi:hypothetical protein